MPFTLPGAAKTAWPASTSAIVSVPLAVGVPGLALLTPPASVTAPVAVPPIVALSFEPVTVTSMICVAVPSLLETLSVSWTVWPAMRLCVAARVLSSV